jgi:hypothetical protein
LYNALTYRATIAIYPGAKLKKKTRRGNFLIKGQGQKKERTREDEEENKT